MEPQQEHRDPRVGRFVDALRQLEQTGGPETLCDLYAPDAVVGSVQAGATGHGPDGARRFWSSYRANVGPAESRFHSVLAGDDRAMLEWTTEVPAHDGGVRYDGVTVLEFDGDRVSRSWAYFNPLALGRQLGPDRHS